MTLVRLAEKEDVPPEVQKVFESSEQQYGQILHTWRAIALNPEIFQAYLPYTGGAGLYRRINRSSR